MNQHNEIRANLLPGSRIMKDECSNKPHSLCAVLESDEGQIVLRGLTHELANDLALQLITAVSRSGDCNCGKEGA